VVKRLLDEADALYARGTAGISRLPLDCRTGIAAAARIYAAIGAGIAAAGYDSVSRRARVTTKHKLGLAARAVLDALWSGADIQIPALPANIPARTDGFRLGGGFIPAAGTQ
jgi:phytoene synthase